jgi:RHS repeat-associated protein
VFDLQRFGVRLRPEYAYYLPARYFDPATCRFLTPDPAAPTAGNPLSLNRYVYCQDDPIAFGDPTGLVLTDFYMHSERSKIGEVNVLRGRMAHAGHGGLKNASNKTKGAVAESTAARLGMAVRPALDVYRNPIPGEYDFGHAVGYCHFAGDWSPFFGLETSIYGELVDYDDLAYYLTAYGGRFAAHNYDVGLGLTR